MRKHNLLELSLTLLLTFVATTATAKDSFGLDAYKQSVESITKPQIPYKTRFGSSISIYTIQNPHVKDRNEAPRRFMVQGGLHGNELLGSEFVAWLAQRFAKGESILNSLNRGNVTIDFLPYANPDGTIQYTRYNGNQINLNRNFGVLWGTTKENPGPKPFSESETRAIRDLLLSRSYTGSIDVHGYVNWVVIPTSPEDGFKDLPTGSATKVDAYKRWISAIRKETKRIMPGYEIKTAGSLGDGGAFEDFAWWGTDTPSACLEIFSKERFLATSIATKLVEILNPTHLKLDVGFKGQQDMFLVYENYVHSLFLEAIKIKDDMPASNQLASEKN